MLPFHRSRFRPRFTRWSLLALPGMLLAALLAGGGGVSAQPVLLTHAMTASHDSLEPGR